MTQSPSTRIGQKPRRALYFYKGLRMKKIQVLILIAAVLSATNLYSQNRKDIVVGIIDLDSDAVSTDGNTIKGHIGRLFQ